MKIEVNINAPELAKSISDLAEALSKKPSLQSKGEVDQEVPKEKSKQDKPKKQEPKKEEKPVEDKAPNLDPVEPLPTEDEAPADDTPPTKEEVRAKAAEVAKAGKKAELKDLLAEFDSGSVSLVPEEKRAEFITRLETI